MNFIWIVFSKAAFSEPENIDLTVPDGFHSENPVPLKRKLDDNENDNICVKRRASSPNSSTTILDEKENMVNKLQADFCHLIKFIEHMLCELQMKVDFSYDTEALNQWNKVNNLIKFVKHERLPKTNSHDEMIEYLNKVMMTLNAEYNKFSRMVLGENRTLI